MPRLQAAKHAGRVRSLFTWDEGTPSVLPRAGLVLIRRERLRRGLLFLRKTKEEGIVEASELWTILESAAEYRDAPSPLLIFRNAAAPPQDVAARLEDLPLQSVEQAKRTSLVGVLDFNPATAKESCS